MNKIIFNSKQPHEKLHDKFPGRSFFTLSYISHLCHETIPCLQMGFSSGKWVISGLCYLGCNTGWLPSMAGSLSLGSTTHILHEALITFHTGENTSVTALYYCSPSEQPHRWAEQRSPFPDEDMDRKVEWQAQDHCFIVTRRTRPRSQIPKPDHLHSTSSEFSLGGWVTNSEQEEVYHGWSSYLSLHLLAISLTLPVFHGAGCPQHTLHWGWGAPVLPCMLGSLCSRQLTSMLSYSLSQTYHCQLFLQFKYFISW